jgi:hypothetical protein
MSTTQYLKEKEAFIFELNGVVFPEKDYYLQVYYLFGQFIEYAEQLNAADIVAFMQQYYLEKGTKDIFNKTAKRFHIPEKYQVNFELLLLSARLPLKLLMFSEVLKFMQQSVVERKKIFLLVDGNAAMQLNVIKQVEWNGLENYLTVYFTEEMGGMTAGLGQILITHELEPKSVIFIGKPKVSKKSAKENNIDFAVAEKLFLS